MYRDPTVETAGCYRRQRAKIPLAGERPETFNYDTYSWTEHISRKAGQWHALPVFYVTDLLQNVEALVALGYRHDPRLAAALDLIRGKQDAAGRWPLEYDYAGKTWGDFGPKKQPNPWVTIRALRVLKAVG